MGLFFALGASCFLVAPFPGYADLVGEGADELTFFIGSVLFTIGGALQSSLAWPERRLSDPGRAAWRAAVVQWAGTLFFNVTTFQATQMAVSSTSYDRLVWRPDAFGSVCFLISGVIAYRAASRHGISLIRGEKGWWEPAVNLLGCVFFGISAIAGYVVPSTGSISDLAAANFTTGLGAACFLVNALATLGTGRTVKAPRFDRLRALEAAVEREVRETT